MTNKFIGRGPYTAVALPVSGSYGIRDNNGNLILKPYHLGAGLNVSLEELEYLTILLNAADLLGGTKG